ncbi:MAG: DUF305 domain-containing protein [Eubacteriales bacterium]|nr:DUF305 domain-containing protein [Eubacteriales bacterium]
MNKNCPLTDDAQLYLRHFHQILDNMIHNMTCAELNESVSHNFITQMIPHHEGAIEMSRNLLCFSPNAVLRDIALTIVTEQTRSIQDMLAILCKCREFTNCRPALCAYQNQVKDIFRRMFCSMRNACADTNIDNNFMREMIPHHRGAVEFSALTLKYCICPQLKPILRQIIVSQNQEICEMEHLLRCKSIAGTKHLTSIYGDDSSEKQSVSICTENKRTD